MSAHKKFEESQNSSPISFSSEIPEILSETIPVEPQVSSKNLVELALDFGLYKESNTQIEQETSSSKNFHFFKKIEFTNAPQMYVPSKKLKGIKISKN